MAENYSSEWDLPLSSLFGKRRLIRREVNALNLMSKLGEDLLVEILIRLPNPKSSCRCKAVCKRWRSLISDPSFNRRFIAHHRSKYQPPSLFIPSHDPQSVLSFLPLPDNARPNLRVFDCFKDLLLCGFVDTCDELRTSYLVCNPFTKQWIALPLAPRTQGYFRSAALLVCQPRSNYNLVADDEPESAAFVYSEYRFRVVLLLQCGSNMTLQVFCSESSTWRQGSRKNVIMSSTNVVWWNELLVWVHYDMPSNRSVVLGYDPFRLDIRPDPMTAPSSLLNRLIDLRGTFSISQGVFHSIVLKVEGVGDRSRYALSVWRVEVEDDKYRWSQRYEIVLKTTPSPSSSSSSTLWGNYELAKCSVLCLHPEKPEIVFFRYFDNCVLYCDQGWGLESQCSILQ
ncbi:Putative F-box/kelch-repeat protein At1g15680 [Linum grandiflorum]